MRGRQIELSCIQKNKSESIIYIFNDSCHMLSTKRAIALVLLKRMVSLILSGNLEREETINEFLP